MSDLASHLVGAGALRLLAALVFAWLARRDGRESGRGHLDWLALWAGLAGSEQALGALGLFLASSPGPLLLPSAAGHEAALCGFRIVSIWALVRGLHDLAGEPKPRWSGPLLVVFVGLDLVVASGASLGRVALASVVVGLALGQLWAARVLARASLPCLGRRLAVAALVASACLPALGLLHQPVPGLGLWARELDAALGTLTALGLLLAHFEHARLQAAAAAETYRALFELAQEGLCRVDGDGRVRFANRRFASLTQASVTLDAEGRGPNLSALLGGPAWGLVRDAWEQGQSVGPVDSSLELASGARLDVELAAWPVRDDRGDAGMQISLRDLTTERQLQAELLHAERLQALGRMAGRVAHDFNNTLTTIGLAAEAARARALDPEAMQAELEAIGGAAERAGALVRQLLAFARKRPMERRRVELSEVLRRAEPLLRSAVGSGIRIELATPRDSAPVLADPALLEQALLNLAINARDAMPDGGRLRVALTVDATAAGGPRAVIEVEDDGVGMDEATRLRAFEPFFTSKPEGQGSGLGLASVYGIITQIGGRVGIESAPGAGCAVRIEIPIDTGRSQGAEERARPRTPPTGATTIPA